MTITERTIGSVTVLDVVGMMTLGEGDALLQEEISRMLKAGKRRIVLNLARMPYIDSSGLMEIAASWATVRKHGGKLWLCEPSSRVADLLRLTKLVTICEIVHEDEIADLASSQPMMAECPICDPPRSFSLPPNTERYSCGACGLTITFARPPVEPVEGELKVRCTRLRIPTYDAEWIDLSVMTRQDITIENRLDLFVFAFVERLWQVLPAPRRVLFSVKYGEATRTGLERLWDLCGRSADGSRAAVVITDITEKKCRQLINRRDAYVDRRKAEAAVGVGDPLSLQVPVRVWRGD